MFLPRWSRAVSSSQFSNYQVENNSLSPHRAPSVSPYSAVGEWPGRGTTGIIRVFLSPALASPSRLPLSVFRSLCVPRRADENLRDWRFRCCSTREIAPWQISIGSTPWIRDDTWLGYSAALCRFSLNAQFHFINDSLTVLPRDRHETARQNSEWTIMEKNKTFRLKQKYLFFSVTHRRDSAKRMSGWLR